MLYEVITASESKEDPRDLQALQLLEALGGMDNVAEINNCATRLRISVKDAGLLLTDSVFRQAGAHGVVRNKDAIQVVIGLSVSQVRDRMENLMKSAVQARITSYNVCYTKLLRVVQMAFVRAWQRLDRYDSRWSFATWLYRIGTNLEILIAAARQRGEPLDHA